MRIYLSVEKLKQYFNFKQEVYRFWSLTTAVGTAIENILRQATEPTQNNIGQ